MLLPPFAIARMTENDCQTYVDRVKKTVSQLKAEFIWERYKILHSIGAFLIHGYVLSYSGYCLTPLLVFCAIVR